MSEKLRLEPYDIPSNSDLAIIIPFFNPTNSIRIVQNLLLVKHYLELSNIPFYICELAFLDYPHVLPTSSNILQLRSNSYMFYKENLISTIEKIIPSNFTKLCIMDADIIFETKNWYSIISSTLDNYDICHPFSQAHNLKFDFTINNSRTNCIKFIKSNTNIIGKDWDTTHIGFMWAFKRTWFLEHFEDRTVIGGGDAFLVYSLFKDHTLFYNRKDIIIYKPFFKMKNTNSITSCDITIYHLFHGLDNKRQYISRFEKLRDIFKQHNIESLENIMIRGEDNVLEWSDAYKPIMNNYMLTYFNNRCDDASSQESIDDISYKFMPIKYSEPKNKDMAVIMCFFNPSKYIRMIQNILFVKNYMELSNIPFFISEIAFFNEPFLFKKNDNIFQYRSESYLFYKENLNKTIEPLLSDKFKKLLFLDGDILFDNPNWYTAISNSLEMSDILLPFKKASWLKSNYKVDHSRENALDSKDIDINWGKEHVGFCLAVNRNIFHNIPVYETFMIGGDTQVILYLKSKGNISSQTNKRYKLITDFLNDSKPLPIIEFTYDSCNLNIFHLNHGSRTNRNYYNIKLILHDFLKNNNLNILSDLLYRREDNILELNSKFKENMNSLLIKYFNNRDEDL